MRKSFFVHPCELGEQEIKTAQPFPRRVDHWWHRLDPYRAIYRSKSTDQYFRSNQAFVKEVHRHVRSKKYRLTYHPLSRMAFYQDVIMLFVWTAVMLVGPMQSTFVFKSYVVKKEAWTGLRYSMRALRCLVGVDIVLRFFRGYMVAKTQEMVMDPARIRGRYLRTFFFFDLAIALLWVPLGVLPHRKDLLWVRIVIFQLNYLVIPRIFTVLDTWDMILKKWQFRQHVRMCFELLTIALLAIHWWSCVLKLVTLVYDTSKSDRLSDSWFSKYRTEMDIFGLSDTTHHDLDLHRDYLVHFSMASTSFFGIDIVRYSTDDPIEMLIFAFILSTGLFFYIWTLARVVEFFGDLNISGRMYEELVQQATNYLNQNHCPKQLKHRILKYYKYKYNRNFFNESIIMNGLSEHLRMEVVLYSSIHLVQNLKAFKGLPKATIGTILTFLKPEIYLAKDVILTVDDDEKQFYFIVYGTCSVQLMNDQEMLHCGDGDMVSNAWGHITGKSGVDFIYKIVAAEPCQMFTMKLEDLRYCCKHHPAFLEKLNQIVAFGTQRISEVYAAAMSHEDDVRDTNILKELKRRRILQHGRHRAELAF